MIWVLFGGLTALAMLGLLMPLLRPAVAAVSRSAYDMVVYRDQLDEISRDIERGLLSPDQAEAARTEIKRRMLIAGETGAAATPAGTERSGGWPSWLIALGLPLLAFGLYALLGSPNLPDQPYAERAAEISEIRSQVALIESTVKRLEEKLKADPSDGKNWAMLARSQRAIGRTEAAKDSYRKAIPLMPSAIEPRIELAGVLIEEGQGPVPEAVDLLRQVLALEPDQPDALYFVAQAELAAGRSQQALAMLSHLVTLLPAGSSDRVEVEKQIERLK
ncbi:c-type cytochrome biogenesis protein CcmI [Magnetospirillum molischianum]|uniref:Cytochrome c-type biogenesis protein cycH n=1 Tax=Magnetospirillum molischianum DSM 120 TaxID=1150626 RepID=H8FVX7_MAGML|nr:c-type cytochrome biogenesis protein CcmI [Magnetospirillum molischianum]CCG42515.1 Cytochrome c-type biogenesis protein cycH [Magnetospirillum molischianum DSM 120]